MICFVWGPHAGFAPGCAQGSLVAGSGELYVVPGLNLVSCVKCKCPTYCTILLWPKKHVLEARQWDSTGQVVTGISSYGGTLS